MNKPRRSRFMGHDYRIEWEPHGELTVEAGESGEEAVRCYGLTTHADQLIQIEDGLNPSREREVLVHEVLHQLFEPIDLDGELEERLVTYLGNALGSHIHSNPSFWRYVTRRIKDNESCPTPPSVTP